MKRFFGLLVILAMTQSGQAFAYSETHDEYTLELKGFSPELIEPTQIMINRMEGRYPTPAKKRPYYFLINMLNNEPSNNLKPFGQNGIVAPKFPDKPSIQDSL